MIICLGAYRFARIRQVYWRAPIFFSRCVREYIFPNIFVQSREKQSAEIDAGCAYIFAEAPHRRIKSTLRAVKSEAEDPAECRRHVKQTENKYGWPNGEETKEKEKIENVTFTFLS